MDFSLKAIFGLDATGVKTELKQLRKSTNDFVNQWGSLGLAAAGGALVTLAKGAADLAASMKDAAESVGMNVQSFQALTYAAEQNGTSQDNLQKSLQKTQVVAEKAREGDKQSIELLSRLRLTWQDLAALPLERKYERLAQAYAKAEDKAMAYNAVSKIFGEDVGPKMVATLDQLGSEGFDKVAKSAADAGHVMSSETIVALEKADQAIANFKKRATIAVGEIVVNFRSEEGLKLLLFQFLKVVGSFGAGIVDAIVEAGGMVKAVFTGAFKGILNFYRDGFIDIIAFAAEQLNSLMPDWLKKRGFAIDVASIDALKSAGKSISEEIGLAIAATQPSTFKKEVGEFWDKRIDDQRLIVAEMNKKDFGADAAKLADAGKNIEASIGKGAAAVKDAGSSVIPAAEHAADVITEGFNDGYRIWKDGIGYLIQKVASDLGNVVRTISQQMGVMMSAWDDMNGSRFEYLGARGSAQFASASDEALAQIVYKNKQLANQLRNNGQPLSANYDNRMEAGRLEIEAQNAQRELDTRNQVRRAFESGGAAGVYRALPGTDPIILDRLIEQFAKQLPESVRTANSLDRIATGLARRGIIPQI